jgi:hypothetical protein
MLSTRARLLFFLALAATALLSTDAEAVVAGVAFDDRNADGVRQAGEPGLPDIVVSNQIDVTRTGADGAYQLPGRGTGVLFVSLPRGRSATPSFWKAVSSDDAKGVDFGLVVAPDSDEFTFVHASDTHLHEDSLHRTRAFLALLTTRRVSFSIVTGDLIRDALRVDEGTATRLYELYTREVRASSVPIWNVPGNHEIFGIERHHSLVAKTHPLFGKGMYRKHLGPNYYSFNRGRVHFVALDTVDMDDLWYYGHVDKAQMEWLARDLAQVPKGTTVVTFNHIPLVTGRGYATGYTDTGAAPSLIRIGDKSQYRHIVANTTEVLKALRDHNYSLSLNGHNHAFERVLLSPLPGATRFHLTASVIGPTNDVVPSPAGVTLYRVRGDAIDDGEFVPLEVAPTTDKR